MPTLSLDYLRLPDHRNLWEEPAHNPQPEQPANLTWGDKDYRTLYIIATTSAYRLEIEMKTQDFVP